MRKSKRVSRVGTRRASKKGFRKAIRASSKRESGANRSVRLSKKKKSKHLSWQLHKPKYFNLHESNSTGMDNAWWVGKTKKRFFLVGNEIGQVEGAYKTVGDALNADGIQYCGGTVEIDTNIHLEELLEILGTQAFDPFLSNTDSLTLNSVDIDIDSLKEFVAWYAEICGDSKTKSAKVTRIWKALGTLRRGEPSLGRLTLAENTWLEIAFTHLIRIYEKRKAGSPGKGAFCTFIVGKAYVQFLASWEAEKLLCEAASAKSVPEIAATLTTKDDEALRKWGFKAPEISPNYSQTIEIKDLRDLAYAARLAFRVMKQVYRVTEFDSATFKENIPKQDVAPPGPMLAS
jgi:hypothetical protein